MESAMNNIVLKMLSSLAAALMCFTGMSASAQTRIEQLALEAPDGDRITGFVYENVGAEKNAPIAILMHGLGGTSLAWLAHDHAFYVDDVARDLIEQGYRVVAIDARSHGARKDEMSPLDRLKGARSGETGPYLAMINGTLSDHAFFLDHLYARYGEPDRVIAVGYSMGAQMAVLFAAQDKRVSHIVTMVPPAVENVPSVAPVNHASQVNAQWLLITASEDQFSTGEQNAALVAAAGANVTRVEFESGHRLPPEYPDAVSNWVEAIAE